MIQPEDIKMISLRWYLNILSSSVQGKPAFPRDVPFGKIRPNETLENFSKINKEINNLKNESKEQKGYGYCIEFTLRKDRRIGEQHFPTRIYFDNLNDYLKFIHKEKEYRNFILTTQTIVAEIPHLQVMDSIQPQEST